MDEIVNRVASSKLITFNLEDLYPSGERKVLDISLTSAHLKMGYRPPVGTHVTVGRTLGRIVRHTDDGVGVEFLAAGKLAN